MNNLLELLIIGGICGVVGYFILLTESGRQIIVGFTGIVFLVTIFWGVWFFINDGESSSKKKTLKTDTRLTLNEVKRISNTFLSCRGNYADTSFGPGTAKRLSSTEMAKPRIEIALNDSNIFMRTRFINKNDNLFSVGLLVPQERSNKLDGMFFREKTPPTSQTISTHFTYTGNQINLNVIDITLNPDITVSSFYSCYED
jgi:hypothetical protein